MHLAQTCREIDEAISAAFHVHKYAAGANAIQNSALGQLVGENDRSRTPNAGCVFSRSAWWLSLPPMPVKRKPSFSRSSQKWMPEGGVSVSPPFTTSMASTCAKSVSGALK